MEVRGAGSRRLCIRSPHWSKAHCSADNASRWRACGSLFRIGCNMRRDSTPAAPSLFPTIQTPASYGMGTAGLAGLRRSNATVARASWVRKGGAAAVQQGRLANPTGIFRPPTSSSSSPEMCERDVPNCTHEVARCAKGTSQIAHRNSLSVPNLSSYVQFGTSLSHISLRG